MLKLKIETQVFGNITLTQTLIVFHSIAEVKPTKKSQLLYTVNFLHH